MGLAPGPVRRDHRAEVTPMGKSLAVVALALSAACAAPQPSLSVTSPRTLREVMAEPGAVEASSARQRLFASSARAVESAQAREVARAPELAPAAGSGGR
ncbi:MAG TPA: hypothetical protein VFI16_03760 [Anaeromyxobacteraceae bacterium]|nr:hypothetical protein [Anaeromyxobacteraceae bacterium]